MRAHPLIVWLPEPDRALSPNARVFWARRHRAASAASMVACVLMRGALRRWRAVGVRMSGYRIVLYPRSARRRDVDNCVASCKAYLDGCARALCQDDCEWRLFGACVRRSERRRGVVAIVFYPCKEVAHG